jgi:hypothetical protein
MSIQTPQKTRRQGTQALYREAKSSLLYAMTLSNPRSTSLLNPNHGMPLCRFETDEISARALRTCNRARPVSSAARARF